MQKLRPAANRMNQAVLLASTLVGSWLGMQQVHEAGHVLAAWLSGGQVEQVVLNPLAISRTDLSNNPYPALVAWGGPVFGIFMPLALWSAAVLFRMPGRFVLQFFAGFCLLANGLYLGLGSWAQIGDCGELLRHGSPIWQLWLFGILSAPAGLGLWNGLGPSFGIGTNSHAVSRASAYGTLLLCTLLILVGFIVGGE